MSNMTEKLEKYFNLVYNIPLISRGGVRKGIHGIEEINGEFYATHFHLKNYVAKGPLIGFINSITSMELFDLARRDNEDFLRWPKVRYSDYNYDIQKYKLSWIIRLYKSESRKYRNDSRMAVSFSNFRRFQRLDKLSMEGVTFLVGKNNSGKSTVVKAILLVLDYLQTQQGNTFSFAKSILNDVNIVTFDRAITSNSNAQSIEFNISIGSVQCRMEISGRPNSTNAELVYFELRDISRGNRVRVNYLKRTIKWEVDFAAIQQKDNVRERQEAFKQYDYYNLEIKKIDNQLDGESNRIDVYSKENLQLKQDRNFLIEKLNTLRKMMEQRNYFVHGLFDSVEKFDSTEEANRFRNVTGFELNFLGPLEIDKLNKLNNYIRSNIEVISNDQYLTSLKHVDLTEREKDEISKNRYFAKKIAASKFGNLYLDSLNETLNHFNKDQFVYLGANPTKQNALFLIRDSGNPLAQAIHEFHQIGSQKDSSEYAFIRKWMKSFEVGDDFNIEIRAGEAYEVLILESSNQDKSIKNINLSDKGMGSLQVMMILFRLACLMRTNRNEAKRVHILVEEPELNLHPALQSKLTELFYEVHEEYGFNFIIETHSEYMIRKSQVLVKETNSSRLKSKHPFKVYYFDVEKGPYEMRYREDGLFMDEFGSGFFDVSANLTFDIL